MLHCLMMAGSVGPAHTPEISVVVSYDGEDGQNPSTETSHPAVLDALVQNVTDFAKGNAAANETLDAIVEIILGSGLSAPPNAWKYVDWSNQTINATVEGRALASFHYTPAGNGLRQLGTVGLQSYTLTWVAPGPSLVYSVAIPGDHPVTAEKSDSVSVVGTYSLCLADPSRGARCG